MWSCDPDVELGSAAAGEYNGLGLLVCCQDSGTFVNPLGTEVFIWHHSVLRFGAAVSQGGKTSEFTLLGRVTNSLSHPLNSD